MRGQLFGGQLSRGKLVRENCPVGKIPGGNFIGDNCPGGQLSRGEMSGYPINKDKKIRSNLKESI